MLSSPSRTIFLELHFVLNWIQFMFNIDASSTMHKWQHLKIEPLVKYSYAWKPSLLMSVPTFASHIQGFILEVHSHTHVGLWARDRLLSVPQFQASLFSYDRSTYNLCTWKLAIIFVGFRSFISGQALRMFWPMAWKWKWCTHFQMCSKVGIREGRCCPAVF